MLQNGKPQIFYNSFYIYRFELCQYVTHVYQFVFVVSIGHISQLIFKFKHKKAQLRPI